MSWLDELLFPRRCPVCQGIVIPWGEMICDPCREKLLPVGDRGCLKCGRRLLHPEEEYCPDCLRKKRSVVRGLSGFDYGEPHIRDMILQVKYHNARQLLDYPCRMMAEQYRDTVLSWQADCLVPVPVHRSRRRKRGFNQAGEIARRLAEVWKLPVEDRLLRRIRRTQPQKELDTAARLANLMQAFAADRGRAGRYQTVILVDDIYTTGSTIEACTRVLLQAGISRVYMVCLAAGRNSG